MEDERMLILDLVDQGRLAVREAVKLIEALAAEAENDAVFAFDPDDLKIEIFLN